MKYYTDNWNMKSDRFKLLQNCISGLKMPYRYVNVFSVIIIVLFNAVLFANSDNALNVKNQNKSVNVDESKAVAKVGDIIITTGEFFNSYEFGPAFVKRAPNSKKKYLDYMINEKLLALEGYKEGLDTTTQAVEFQHAIISDIATEELFKDSILNTIEISQAEVNTVVNMKKIELDISWLYSENASEIDVYWQMLNKGARFDSLLQSQLNDTVFLDMRSMQTNRYQLGKKNPMLAGIIDTLRVQTYSLPIHTEDGWYIVKLNNVWNNIITTESETQKFIYEARQAITKQKMDVGSDKYVNQLLLSTNPVIKSKVFIILRGYIAQYVLPEEKFHEWNIKEITDRTLGGYNNLKPLDYNDLTLIEYDSGNSTLSEYLVWYRSRSQYIKFNKTSLATFSKSLEQLVWQMLRDKLLFEKAAEYGYTELESVKAQSNWWKDKISFSVMLNQLQNSISIKNSEVHINDQAADSDSEQKSIEHELSVKLFRKIQELKKEYKVEVYDEVLKNIQVSTENDPRAIDIYTVKKGGLIPRTPYPVIDMIWKLWE